MKITKNTTEENRMINVIKIKKIYLMFRNDKKVYRDLNEKYIYE